jgi:hypothetical protein
MMMVLVLMIVIDDNGNDDVDDIVYNDYGDGDNNGDNEFESDRWR